MARNREVDLEVRNIYNAVSEGKTTITSNMINVVTAIVNMYLRYCLIASS